MQTEFADDYFAGVSRVNKDYKKMTISIISQ